MYRLDCFIYSYCMKKIKTLPYAYYQISLKIILKDRSGKILLLKCIPNGSMPGYYDLPGGRINKNELTASLPKLIARELKEELGHTVRYKLHEQPVAIGRHWYHSKLLGKKQNILWVLFEASFIQGKIKTSSEHTDYRWIKITKKNASTYFTKGALLGIKNYLTHKLS